MHEQRLKKKRKIAVKWISHVFKKYYMADFSLSASWTKSSIISRAQQQKEGVELEEENSRGTNNNNKEKFLFEFFMSAEIEVEHFIKWIDEKYVRPTDCDDMIHSQKFKWHHLVDCIFKIKEWLTMFGPSRTTAH